MFGGQLCCYGKPVTSIDDKPLGVTLPSVGHVSSDVAAHKNHDRPRHIVESTLSVEGGVLKISKTDTLSHDDPRSEMDRGSGNVVDATTEALSSVTALGDGDDAAGQGMGPTRRPPPRACGARTRGGCF
eukprot:COSAG01_NODE_4450_length_5008_cov_2.475657_4_plen_129_part_00